MLKETEEKIPPMWKDIICCQAETRFRLKKKQEGRSRANWKHTNDSVWWDPFERGTWAKTPKKKKTDFGRREGGERTWAYASKNRKTPERERQLWLRTLKNGGNAGRGDKKRSAKHQVGE